MQNNVTDSSSHQLIP